MKWVGESCLITSLWWWKSLTPLPLSVAISVGSGKAPHNPQVGADIHIAFMVFPPPLQREGPLLTPKWGWKSLHSTWPSLSSSIGGGSGRESRCPAHSLVRVEALATHSALTNRVWNGALVSVWLFLWYLAGVAVVYKFFVSLGCLLFGSFG